VVLAGLLVLYFGLFAFEGDRGVASLKSLDSQLSEAEQKLAVVKAERETIERKVIALRPASLDGDLLEEEARSELGFVKPDEIVILGR